MKNVINIYFFNLYGNFGTYQLTDKTKLENAIKHSYSIGIKKVDTAQLYRNESMINDIINDNQLDIKISTKISKTTNLNYVNSRIKNSIKT